MTIHTRDPGAALARDVLPTPSHADATAVSGPRRPAFLFSVDLEDVRTLVPDGFRYRDRVAHNTGRILEFLRAHDRRCTFFTVGDIARRYPDLVRRILDDGHEIGSHGDLHIPLDRLDTKSFALDLERCLESLARAGATAVRGFRAPIGSLTSGSRWAYGVLREFGFEYSSSVNTTRSPLYGWPEFGPDRPRRVDGVWEIPPTVTEFPLLNVPVAGGVFLRVVPLPVILWTFRRKLETHDAIVSYLHPYDVDDEQERFMHPELWGSSALNRLMFVNRHDVFRRLDRLFAHEVDVVPFAHYVRHVLGPFSDAARAE